jgi:hypothetical protein
MLFPSCTSSVFGANFKGCIAVGMIPLKIFMNPDTIQYTINLFVIWLRSFTATSESSWKLLSFGNPWKPESQTSPDLPYLHSLRQFRLEIAQSRFPCISCVEKDIVRIARIGVGFCNQKLGSRALNRGREETYRDLMIKPNAWIAMIMCLGRMSFIEECDPIPGVLVPKSCLTGWMISVKASDGEREMVMELCAEEYWNSLWIIQEIGRALQKEVYFSNLSQRLQLPILTYPCLCLPNPFLCLFA